MHHHDQLEKKCLYSKEHLWDSRPEWKLFPGLECSVSFCGDDLSPGDPEHCGPFPPFSLCSCSMLCSFVHGSVTVTPTATTFIEGRKERREEGKKGERMRKKRKGRREGRMEKGWERGGGREEEKDNGYSSLIAFSA